MQRRHALPLILLSPLALNGCGALFVARHVAKAWNEAPPADAALDQALQRYHDAVLRADIDQLAAMFTLDAQVSHGSAPAVAGREAIHAWLESLAEQRVQEFELKARMTRVDGDSATQSGSYRRRTVSPQGGSVEVQGLFDARWARQSGHWLLARMHTESI